jgi:hypothetical protein
MVAGFSPTGAEIADFYGAGRRIEGAGRVRFPMRRRSQCRKTRIGADDRDGHAA